MVNGGENISVFFSIILYRKYRPIAFWDDIIAKKLWYRRRFHAFENIRKDDLFNVFEREKAVLETY